MAEFEGSMLEEVIEKEITAYESLPADSKERVERAKVICQLMDKYIENYKFVEELDFKREELEFKKEQFKKESMIKERENDLKEVQIKNDEKRTWTEFGKGLMATSVFVLFEILAHKRDILDVIDRDPMHVKKNPLKLKLF